MLKAELSIDELLAQRRQYESIRDKADGAVQAIDLIINHIRSLDEQEQKKEREAGAENGAIDPAATGNGYAHKETGTAETESEANG